MKGVTFLPGVLFASASIGVLIAAAGVLIAALTNTGDGASALLAAPLAMMLAMPLGFVASFLPNLAGTALLAWLGRGNVGVRLPVFWALAGAGTGAGIATVLSGANADAGSTAILAGIGAVSALLCRSKTDWNVDQLSKEASGGEDRERTHPARAVARPRRHAADRWLD